MRNVAPMRPRFTALAILATTAGVASSEAAEPKFALNFIETSVCDRIYSIPEVSVNDPSIQILWKEVALPGSDLTMTVPDVAISFAAGKSARISSSGKMTSPHPLLPAMPITSDDPEKLEIYCDRLAAVENYFSERREPLSIETRLVDIRLSPSSKNARAELRTGEVISGYVARPAPSNPPTPLEHLVIYTSAYRSEAFDLSALQRTHGLASQAVSLEQIPGVALGSPLPPECSGVYANECALSPTASVTGMTLESTAALVGIRYNPSPSRQPLARDSAGLVRAYLRAQKTRHPELRYVVLMGDPTEIPARYTNERLYTAPVITQTETRPTDFYYAEVFEPWTHVSAASFAAISPIGYPCGYHCTAPNAVGTTTRFTWPVKYPFARTMVKPYPAANPRGTPAQILSIGRIIAKAAAGLTKDPAVREYVNKLTAWEAAPRPPSQVIISGADGVYVPNYLQHFETELGPFHFVGEGFGSSYVTNANRPADWSTTACLDTPPQNDWHSFQPTPVGTLSRMSYYQSEPINCKPFDGAGPRRLNNPNEVTQYITANGFNVMFLGAHGSYSGIGFQTGGNGTADRRGYRVMSVPKDRGGTEVFEPTDRGEDFSEFKFPGGRPNGFMVSSGCDPSSYFQRQGIDPLFPMNRRSTGEVLLSAPSSGAIGTYMNYDVGYFVRDPTYDMALATAMKHALTQTTSARIGDALIGLWGGLMQAGTTYYEMTNRLYLGDPAARMAP